MKRFIQGEHRGQGTLLPESLDDYVSDTNPVRVVDVFVDELDLVNLGFEGAIPADTGRPSWKRHGLDQFAKRKHALLASM
jgi:transposase